MLLRTVSSLSRLHSAGASVAPAVLTASSSSSLVSVPLRSRSSLESPIDSFEARHLGPRAADQQAMLKKLKVRTVDKLIEKTVPSGIRGPVFEIGKPQTEVEALASLRKLASKNKVFKNFIGQGYYGTHTPLPILRNLLENPGWYTSYTPYQAEVSQGRLESLMNFQVMVSDLTGFPVAGASLLDEATAAAEAMALCVSADKRKADNKIFVVHKDTFRQTVAVVSARAEARGIKVVSLDLNDAAVRAKLIKGDYGTASGVLVQYPAASGEVFTNMQQLASDVHAAGALFVCATDLLALTVLQTPAEFGADICLGSAQRFGVPPGFGGPHAAFFATADQFVRSIPGRIIGMSQDATGRPAYRMALQTREQHIRRERATSNICTAQALLANMAAMYAVYHGPDGLRKIGTDVHGLARALHAELGSRGVRCSTDNFFDTVAVPLPTADECDAVIQRARAKRINLGRLDANTVVVAFDETSSAKDIAIIAKCFAPSSSSSSSSKQALPTGVLSTLPQRSSPYLQHPIFNTYRSETEMTRYIYRLAEKDISLTRSMISLGSCTMKLNSTSEMIPVTWPEFGQLHPFCPAEQSAGYREMITHLEGMLATLTGMAATSLQPNAGSQGEFAGLLVIRSFLRARDGNDKRNVCLIPRSAHGTNPASAAMAGMEIVIVSCKEDGEVNMDDFHAKVAEYKDRLACLMITYPSTHGVFEETISEICTAVHAAGGQVYMDGANMNAQCGITSPGSIGADVCHLNLHKTFCIPHGGGGPGVGPICVATHLAKHLPTFPAELAAGVGGGASGIEPVSAAPYGSAGILPIPYLYLRMMGTKGIRRATQTAILNANYMAKQLEKHYPVLYTGKHGFVAHEFIIDCRHFEKTSGVVAEDIAKRLIDFGFHAPTMSFPVPGTLMIEPTESESKEELDRFVNALIHIRSEIDRVAAGDWPRDNNPLKHAPHTAEVVTSEVWDRPYTRQEAAFPVDWVRLNKYWPPVSRVDNVFGDKNLKLSCPCEPIESYMTPAPAQ